jgi:hypothetical protein
VGVKSWNRISMQTGVDRRAYPRSLLSWMQFIIRTSTESTVRKSGKPKRRLSWLGRGQRHEYIRAKMPLHEDRLFLRNVHMNTPELVEELLVSGHQIGKCLRQHPRCHVRYPNRSAMNGSGPCQEGGTYYLPSLPSFVHAVRR